MIDELRAELEILLHERRLINPPLVQQAIERQIKNFEIEIKHLEENNDE